MSNKSVDHNWYETWFNSLYPKLYPHRDLKEAEIQIKSLTNLIQVKDSCLDVACGTGRHIKYLSELYKEVCGIDLSKDLIEIGERQGNFKNAHVQVADMRDPPFTKNKFDLITNFFTGFGYFQTDQEHQELLITWSQLLKHDGVLVIDYLNKDHLINNLIPETTRTIDNYQVTESRTIKENRIEKNITVKFDKNSQNFIESVRMYDSIELTNMLKNCGFKIIKLYGDFNWETFTKNSTRLIIVSSNVNSNFKK